MVAVAVEKIGWLFFHPMGKTKRNATRCGSLGLERNAKLRDGVDVKIDSVEVVTEFPL
jgi:hypothetical protein